MNPADLVQVVLGGLAMGAIYALVALGLYVTHLATHRVNFGQGDFMMAAAYLTIATRAAGLPAPLAIAVVVAGLAVMGWALERVAIRPLERRRHSPVGGYAWILTTAGVALIVQNVIELRYGKSSQYSPPLFSDQRDHVVRFLGVGVFVEELLVIVAASMVVLAFYLFMFRSRWGQCIRTVAFDADAAALLGIHTQRVKVGVFVIAAMLAAVGGVLIGPMVTIHPQMGLIFTIKALIVAATGGLSNPIGIFVGGLLFGVAEAGSNYLDSDFGDLYPLLVALALIAIRPAGLFSERAADVR